MKEVRFWLAEDGKRFDDEYDCIEYERRVILNEYKDDFVFLDCSKEVIPIENAQTDNIFYIIIKHQRCAPVIGGWFKEDNCSDPFDGMYDKTVEGTWVYGAIIDKGDEWYLLEFEIEKLQTLIKELNQGAE